MKKYLLLLSLSLVLTACSNEEPEVTTESEDSEEVARLKEENEELKRQQKDQENDAEHEGSKESTKDQDIDNQDTAERSDEKQETSSNTSLASNDNYVNEILSQPDYMSKYSQANTADTERYSMLVEEYIYRLAGYYKSGQRHAKDVFFYLEEGSTPYNTVIENQKSGNFANYEIEEVVAYQVFDIGDGNVIVDTYRTYTHANTNGVQGSDVTYIMNKDSYKVLGWIETDTYDISEDGHKHCTYGLTSYGDEQGDSFANQMSTIVQEYIVALASYYNNGEETVFNYTDGSVENTLKNNYKNGNFNNYENHGMTILSVSSTMDDDVFVDVERAYSHATSDGIKSSKIQYHLVNEKIVGWTE